METRNDRVTEISIIVPVYNVEKYLKRCIESLVKQTYNNVEIILVDDGSTDGSGEICDSYETNHSNVTVIHKTNSGVSCARNAGMRRASGEYLMFVDSDDCIELDSCGRIVECMGDCRPDVFVGNAREISSSGVKPIGHRYGSALVLKGQEFLSKQLESGCFGAMVWLSLYRRDFINEKGLFFKDIRAHEDELYTPTVLMVADMVLAADITFYNYYKREGSLSSEACDIKHADEFIEVLYELERIYLQVEDVKFRKILMESLMVKYLHLFQMYGLYKVDDVQLVNDYFVKGRAVSLRNRLKAFVFQTNKRCYYYMNAIVKKISFLLDS